MSAKQPPHSSPRRRMRYGAVGASVATLAATLAAAPVANAARAHTSSSLVVSAVATTRYGVILQSTHTVYVLKPSRVACSATCLHYWPEVLLPRGTTKAVAGRGVSAARLGTIKRPGGRLQVTYNHKPLYWFLYDTARGQVNGNTTDTWGTWSVVVLARPAGAGISTTTTTRGGYGY